MLQLDTPEKAVAWLRGRVTGTLQTDSRKVRAGDGFIAWPGYAVDGRRFVPAALAQGAGACLVEAEGAESWGLGGDVVAAYAGLKQATGVIAAEWFGHPARQLAMLAITGTNGKTSTAWWLAQMLSKLELPAQIPCAVVGTLGMGIAPRVTPTGLTTPDPVALQRQLADFVRQGVAACAIEASSIGIAEGRLAGTPVRVAIFTNFTQDHLDYHGDMHAYWVAKRALFDDPALRAACINIDDPRGAALAGELAGRALDVWTVSCERDARLRAVGIRYAAQGLEFTVAEGGERHALCTQLIGNYNVSNLLGVIAAARALGVPLAAAVAACATLLPVPGRMECAAPPGQPLVAVDYAHTPDALDKALGALRPLARQRGGRLWCVFGCGGDRDATKRPLMAAVAEKGADMVVVTSDNPRSEKPKAIISQILLGLGHEACVQVQADRARAISETLAQAAPADVVLVAGKGHEDYQEIDGVRHPFSDMRQVQAALLSRQTGGAA
ncbi:UDP-N-acetylmuramoyl-L-alanyl-D-glutamate--2,6-diaminopimelate ligase [Ramlibacter sp. H39-3-26]|uniref:UDP-N-acetylmuramoyl-L-alanyl-D-glutamate--2, 6-diaminopimelate ligase n=1 Tax=Curvibacter soli TaxID=3031331 RepID=UPI0023D9B3A4|nr:UDP-N-acetylmuramoyl-L-alanyl-D-glutamate--2,6-diaminopimelate ligase [Ramlibacter sp. H39-3-26]MDF1484682.1 UDP-N-acetylmuramoyl-L-alanyl-D-glutamate--2,6-diaminopimelate ligase [Ramlibacter sp. H39-3-26]